MESIRQQCAKLDKRIADSRFGRFFRLDGSGHKKEIKSTRFLTEVRAGLTTFFTMSYVISVNAAILTDSGGSCKCNDPKDRTCANNTEYKDCLLMLNRDLITATIAVSAFGSFFFGLITNLPVALAPGMGLNAYFAYQVVGYHGTGSVSYGLALTAVFTEGFIFVLLSLLGMRQWLVRLLPTSLKVAAACGIGLFLAEIGLSYNAGIGAITGATSTPLDLGGCPQQYRNALGECQSHKMQNPSLWIAIFCGGVLTAVLMAYKIKSAMIIGILVVSAISWPRSTSFTYFPHTPDGNVRFDFFKQVVTFHPLRTTLNALEWDVSAAPGHFVLALFTFLYVDIIDCTATLYSMARFSGVVDASTGDFPRSTLAYCTDAVSIAFGSLLGVSPVTAYIESGAGIAEGGRTGITAVTAGICFFITLFFAPVFASIPTWATGSTVILVGAMMVRQVTAVNWNYIGDAVPAFVTIVFIPMSYSTAYGVIAGMLIYIAINVPLYLIRLITCGHVRPVDEERREYWSFGKYNAGDKPLWFVSLGRNIADRMGGKSRHPDVKVREVSSRETLEEFAAKGAEIPLGDVRFSGSTHQGSDRSTQDSSAESSNVAAKLAASLGASGTSHVKVERRSPSPPQNPGDRTQSEREDFDLRQFRVPPRDSS